MLLLLLLGEHGHQPWQARQASSLDYPWPLLLLLLLQEHLLQQLRVCDRVQQVRLLLQQMRLLLQQLDELLLLLLQEGPWQGQSQALWRLQLRQHNPCRQARYIQPCRQAWQACRWEGGPRQRPP